MHASNFPGQNNTTGGLVGFMMLFIVRVDEIDVKLVTPVGKAL